MKRNPADLTDRNLAPLRRRLDELERRVLALEQLPVADTPKPAAGKVP